MNDFTCPPMVTLASETLCMTARIDKPHPRLSQGEELFYYAKLKIKSVLAFDFFPMGCICILLT